MTLQSWLNRHDKSLGLANRIESVQAAMKSPQIALIKKTHPQVLAGRLIMILMDLTKYVECHWDQNTVASIAKMIQESFWMLRIDELNYVLNKGINGQYGKIYGKLQYVTLTEWISAYMEGERAETIINEKTAANHRLNAKSDLSDVPAEILYLDAKYKAPEKKEKEPVNEDDRQWGYFIALKSTWNDTELQQALKIAESNGYEKTKEAIKSEIKNRKNL